MKKVISLLLVVIILLSLSACTNNEFNNTISDYSPSNKEQDIKPEEIITYTSSYEPGVMFAYEYYSRWLNLIFFDSISKYDICGKSDKADDAYIEAKRYFGADYSATTELEIIDSGLNNGFIGIYVQDSNGKTLKELTNELKTNTEKALQADLGEGNLIWEWSDDTEITLFNQKYQLLSLKRKIVDDYGSSSWYTNYTYWDLCRVKDDKLIIIHCSGLTGENNLDEMLSVFQEIGAERETISFGTYEQDGVTTNGKEKIEWHVLSEDVENNRALILSKKALAYEPFTNSEFMGDSSNEENNCTYEESSIRAWLNTTFLNDAFNNEEKKKIIVTNVAAEKNPQYNTSPGNDCNDLVFILSISEFEKYFATKNQKKAQYITNSVNQTIIDKFPNMNYGIKHYYNLCLRNPGAYGGSITRVTEDGSISSGNAMARGIIHPAMWISLD